MNKISKTFSGVLINGGFYQKRHICNLNNRIILFKEGTNKSMVENWFGKKIGCYRNHKDGINEKRTCFFFNKEAKTADCNL